MKIEVERDVFAAALARLRGAVSGQDNMPILRSAFVRPLGNDRIEMMATDLDLTMRLFVGAAVTDPGAGCGLLPVKESLGIARSFLERRLTLEWQSDNKVHLHAGKSRRALPAMPAEDYPLIPDHRQRTWTQVDKLALVSAFANTLYAASTENEAWSIAGVFLSKLDSSSTHYRVAASDGHRLAWQDLPDPVLGGLNLAGSITLPHKGILEFAKLLEPEGPAWVAVEDDCFWVKTTEAAVWAKLMEAGRPDMECIVPETRPSSLVLDFEDLHRVLKSMGVLASGKNQPIELGPTRGALRLKLVGQALGEAEDEISAEYDGEDYRLCVNLRYLMDVAAVMGAGPGRLEWLDDMHGICLVRPAEPNMFHLVMPVMV